MGTAVSRADGDECVAGLHHLAEAGHWLDVDIGVDPAVHVKVEDAPDVSTDRTVRDARVEASNLLAIVRQQEGVALCVRVHAQRKAGIEPKPRVSHLSRGESKGRE